MKKKKTFFLQPDLRIIGIPLVSLFGIIVCFVVGFRIAFEKISAQKKQISVFEKNIQTLKNKEATLAQVKSTLENDIQFFALALPDSNPSLLVFYQLRNFAAQNGVLLDNIKSGIEGKEKEYSKVDLGFDLLGDILGILNLIQSSKDFAPIISIEKLKLTQIGGTYTGTVNIRGYWDEFPKKIPAITQPLNNFTDEEIETIVKISQLSIPPFYNLLPTVTSDRENPF